MQYGTAPANASISTSPSVTVQSYAPARVPLPTGTGGFPWPTVAMLSATVGRPHV